MTIPICDELRTKTTTTVVASEDGSSELKRKPKQKRTESKQTHFSRLDSIIRISREAPTIQLFDAIWQHFPLVGRKKRKSGGLFQKDILYTDCACKPATTDTV